MKGQQAGIGRNVVLSDDTIMGYHVRIGNNVTIYPGVTIGDDCTIFDGAVIGRPPKSTGTMTRPVDSGLKTLVIGAGSVIGANAVLYTGTSIGVGALVGDLASIREGCSVGDGAVIGRGVLVMYDTSVGARSRVIDGAILTGNMTIEEDVFIGPGVNSVNDNDVYLKRFGLQPFEVQGPLIRRFALIGTGANLAAGVEIGMGAVVAPSAMVTHDVAAWSVVAGVPAKLVRMIEDEQRRRILAQFNLPDVDDTQ
ncbi:MAG: N-acetyltransferase [Burkholderiales bacterium]|nr:N-acetyltransferase [Anaerolineae bacterium]